MGLLKRLRPSIHTYFLLGGIGLTVWGVRRPLPPSHLADSGWTALTDTLFTLALWAYLVLLGAALGRWTLRQVGRPWMMPGEEWLWTMPTGLALLGYPVYLLGLLGLLRSPWIAALVLGMTIWLRHDVHAAMQELRQAVRLAWAHLARLPRAARWAWGIMAALLGSSFLLALTPPVAYDALWYHLQAPRLFLEAGRIYPEFNNWPANYAFALNMVYAIPMALGSDRAPQLVHWTFGIALLGIAYRLPRSAAGSLAWIAPAFVLTMPAFLFQLAPQPLLDVAAACLEVMTFGGLMRAAEGRSKQWLIAAGIWAGLAVGTKLSSLPVLVAGLIFWIWRGRSTGWIERARGILYFLSPALALATPWYLKNALWFGAPLFPAGLQSADPEVRFRNLLFLEYINQGEQQGINRLLFFYWLLTAPDRLDYVTGPLALWFLPLLLLAVPLQGPAMDALALSGLRALLWIVSPPGIRFLISTFALLGVALAIIAGQGWRDPRLPRRLAAQWIASSHLMFITVLLLTMGAASVFSQPWRVALGLESPADYLRRKLEGYRGMEYVRDHLGPEERILLIADARHYYCPSRCYPEADHFTWPRIVRASHFNPEAVLDRLEAMGISHLWIHHGSVKWLLAHDPQGWMRRSYDFLQIEIMPSCAARIYSDEDVEILRLLCRSGADHRGHERDMRWIGSEDSGAGGAP